MKRLYLKFPKLDQLDYRLRAALDVKFLHDIRDVVSDGFFTYKQLFCNVPSRFVLHKQFKYFPLPMSKQKFAVAIAALQNVSPLLARVLLSNKVKGYSQHIL